MKPIAISTAVLITLASASAMAQTNDFPPYNNRDNIRPAPNYQTAPTQSQQQQPFRVWLQQVANDAFAAGISSATILAALDPLTVDERVIENDQNQPENTQTFASYASHTVNPDKVAEGREQLHLHSHLLNEISAKYGVPPEVIVALWGVESGFGRNSGRYEIVSSLATLAYEGRRGEFFRKQLLDSLRILDQEHMRPSELRGSWAGAMGQCQFMPSTYLNYAVDYRGKGRRDIWKNQADVFASIANYLAAEGWQRDLTWGREVSLTKSLPETEIGLTIKHTLKEWADMGVRTAHGMPLPDQDIEGSLVQPDGLDGRSFLVYDNFRAIMKWNRSTYFATSIGLLADKIKPRQQN